MNGGGLEILDARRSAVGELPVRRALPARGRRTIGAWCFLDHMGPATYRLDARYDVAPHPHIGLSTVTWLFEGGLVHRDSLGSEQLIRAGELNVMSAGEGVVHSEENPGLVRGELHGVQLWVAQPNSTRHGPPAFEHHAALPRFDLARGEVTVVLGAMGGVDSPGRRDGELVGAQLRLARGVSVVPLRASYEYGLVVAQGAMEVAGSWMEPGRLVYLAPGRDELALRAREATLAVLVGGEPFDEDVVMWWNFVARTREEISEAYESWAKGGDRFAPVASSLTRVEVGPPPWHLGRR